MAAGTSGEVTVVIPQHGQIGLTLDCVRGLFSHHPDLAKVIVVDDGSPADDLRSLQSVQWPRTDIIPHDIPRGTTAAWNTGLQRVTTGLVILLNNDVTSSGRWIDRLIAPLLDGKSPCSLTGVAIRQESLLAQIRPAIAADVKLLEGWCLAARTDDLKALDGFDERFRLYFSDTDLQCRLLQTSPNALRHVPRLPVKHLAHRSTRYLQSRNQIWRQDRKRFLEKWDRESGRSGGTP